MHNYKLPYVLSCPGLVSDKAASERENIEAAASLIKCLYFYQNYKLDLRQAVLITGMSLVVQDSLLPMQGPQFDPWSGTRSHMLQPRV